MGVTPGQWLAHTAMGWGLGHKAMPCRVHDAVSRLRSRPVASAPVLTYPSSCCSFSPPLPPPQPLLERLFAGFKLPDSSENEYLMRCVMRVIGFVGPAIAPVSAVCLQVGCRASRRGHALHGCIVGGGDRVFPAMCRCMQAAPSVTSLTANPAATGTRVKRTPVHLCPLTGKYSSAPHLVLHHHAWYPTPDALQYFCSRCRALPPC